MQAASASHQYCLLCLVVFIVQVVSLERFQSLQDKMLLLDKAVDGHDGNIITAVGLPHFPPRHQNHLFDFIDATFSLHFRY